jgi:hypothetical protein
MFVDLSSSVARGGAMGFAPPPPNQNCLALDRIDFPKLDIQEFNIKIDFKSKMFTCTPKTNFWLLHWVLGLNNLEG